MIGRPCRCVALALAAGLALGIASCGGDGPGETRFTATGSMATGRWVHTATLLPGGKVLVAGGFSSLDARVALASAELYDPGTGAFTTTGSLATARGAHTATLLPGGEVLVPDGLGTGSYDALFASAELYDPAAGTFAPTGEPLVHGGVTTSTLLSDGKVLVAGGQAAGGHAVDLAELYDPSPGTFTATESLTVPRYGHTATLLPSGKVLVAAGDNGSHEARTPIASAEVYDPEVGTFTLTGSLATARAFHTATLLPSGKVLVVGGLGSSETPVASAELYDPALGTFTTTGSMALSRWIHTATLLADGKVLVTGGLTSSGNASASAELYDPAVGTFAAAGTMRAARFAHTATLLADGKVLIVGGSSGYALLASAELYDPP